MSSSTSLNPTASSSQTFHSFARLPLELRTQIWHVAAQCPRVVDLWRLPIGTLSFHTTYPNQPPSLIKTYRFNCTRPVPSLLHVNQESRSIALLYYVLAFGCTNIIDEEQGIVMTAPARIYVNWKTDRILFLGERDGNAIPDALADVPAEGAAIAIEVSGIAFDEERSGEQVNELTAIAGNGGVREVLFYNSELPEGMQLAVEFFNRLKNRPKRIEVVELKDGEEQTLEF